MAVSIFLDRNVSRLFHSTVAGTAKEFLQSLTAFIQHRSTCEKERAAGEGESKTLIFL
jgi:hypothetical protein